MVPVWCWNIKYEFQLFGWLGELSMHCIESFLKLIAFVWFSWLLSWENISYSLYVCVYIICVCVCVYDESDVILIPGIWQITPRQNGQPVMFWKRISLRWKQICQNNLGTKMILLVWTYIETGMRISRSPAPVLHLKLWMVIVFKLLSLISVWFDSIDFFWTLLISVRMHIIKIGHGYIM